MKKLLELFGLVRIKDLKPVIIKGPGLDRPIYRRDKDLHVPLLDVGTMETEHGHPIVITDFSVINLDTVKDKSKL